MKKPQEKCTAQAKITLPWGGKLLNYCPVHANQIALLAQAIGSSIQAQPFLGIMECESNTLLTEEEKKLNETFQLKSL